MQIVAKTDEDSKIGLEANNIKKPFSLLRPFSCAVCKNSDLDGLDCSA